MAIKYAFTEYPVAFPSKVLASEGGAHIYNVELGTEAWNGAVIKRGDFKSLDLYAEAAATVIKGKIVGTAANGNFYFEITESTDDALIVYNVPMIADDSARAQHEKNFYVGKGEVARAYSVRLGDVWELSASAFSGTPAVGKTVATVSGKKLVIAA